MTARYPDVILQRREDGMPQTNVPRRIVRHSPSGYEWGYGGSGPADLALNILLMFADAATAERLYQDFKWHFIATMPASGGVIPAAVILQWLQERGVPVQSCEEE